MTQNLLGRGAEKYLLKLNKYRAFIIVLGALAVLINLLFLRLRTDENHSILLVLSIILTVLFGWTITALVGIVIKPMRRLYELSLRPTECVSVKIDHINTERRRVEHFDCFEVHTSESIYFLVVDGNIRLNEGDRVTLLIASNIITGVRA